MSQAVGTHTSSQISPAACRSSIAPPPLKRLALLNSATHQWRPQHHDLYLALRTVAELGLESSLGHGVASVDEDRCMGGQLAILQQTFPQFLAITGHQLLDQAAQRGLFRDHNRLLAPPHETLDETDKYYFH